MGNSITGSLPRVTSTNIPAATDVPETAGLVQTTLPPAPADAGFKAASTFDNKSPITKSGTAADLFKTGSRLSDRLTKLSTKIETSNTTTLDGARTESLGLSDAGLAFGLGNDVNMVAKLGAQLIGGDKGVQAFTDKTKTLSKGLSIADNAFTMVTGGDLVTQAKAAVSLAGDVKSFVKVSESTAEKIGTNLAAATRLVGAAAAVVNVEKNSVALVDNIKKAAHGDVKAAFDGVGNVVQIANAGTQVVKEAASGAKLLGVATEAAEKTLTVVAKAGPLLKKLPLIGAAIGTAKAGYDFYKNPSLMNGAKVAANAIGMLPGAGPIVSMIATTALDHPELVKKGYDLTVKGAKIAGAAIADAGKAAATAVTAQAHAFVNAGAKAWSFLTGS